MFICRSVKIGQRFLLRAPKTDGERRYTGGWFLERPIEGKTKDMWFGQVQDMFVHDGDVFLKVQWYTSQPLQSPSKVFHSEIRAPLVTEWNGPGNKEGGGIEIVHVSHVVPWACYGSKLSESQEAQNRLVSPKFVMVARHWHILRALGLPSPPSKLKFPSLLIKPSIQAMGGPEPSKKKAKK